MYVLHVDNNSFNFTNWLLFFAFNCMYSIYCMFYYIMGLCPSIVYHHCYNRIRPPGGGSRRLVKRLPLLLPFIELEIRPENINTNKWKFYLVKNIAMTCYWLGWWMCAGPYSVILKVYACHSLSYFENLDRKSCLYPLVCRFTQCCCGFVGPRQSCHIY